MQRDQNTDTNNLQLNQDNQINIINVNVFFLYQNTSQHQIKIDQNTPLKNFVESCKQKIQSITDGRGRIQYIQIGAKNYEETDERNLKDIGVQNKSNIYIIISNKGIVQQQNNIQFDEIKAPEQLINNYKNILFSSLDANQQKRIIGMEQEVLIQSFSNSEQNQNQQKDPAFQYSKYHVINNAFRRNFEEKMISDNLKDPLKVVQQQKIDEKNINQDILMVVLAEQMKQSGQTLYQTQSNDLLNILSLQASFAYGLDDTTCLQLTIKNNEEINYQQLKDQQYLLKFQNQLKQELANQFQISPDEITLLQMEEGSIKVYFKITNEAGVSEQIEWQHSINQIYKKFPDAQLVLHNYFQVVQLSSDDFDPKYNIEWDQNHIEFDIRGPNRDQMKYFFPRGWKGYALKVQGKYDQGNDDWLKMDGNANEWHIMYHGTRQYIYNNDGTKQLCVKGILEQGLKPGQRQQYEDVIDIRLKQKIGSGVYFSNHIEVAQKYCEPIAIDGYNYQVVFQSRVNPQKLKQIKKKSCFPEKKGNADWDNDYFVVNKPEDIRPYRILLKKQKLVQKA